MRNRIAWVNSGLAWAILLIVAGLTACNEEPRPVKTTAHIRLNDERLIRFNQYKLKTEDQYIEDLIQRYQWNMTASPTGLRYMIYQKGNGISARTGMEVELDYEVRLLNGKRIYSADSTGPKTFILGYGGVESGLEEALLLMRQGDKAKLIIPSYLAYGMMGDENRIPPGAALIYDVKIKRLHYPH